MLDCGRDADVTNNEDKRWDMEEDYDTIAEVIEKSLTWSSSWVGKKEKQPKLREAGRMNPRRYFLAIAQMNDTEADMGK